MKKKLVKTVNEVNKFLKNYLAKQKKTDLIIQVTPSIIKDNYSGIDKKDYHKDAENKAFEEN